jgi:hypothetical protein
MHLAFVFALGNDMTHLNNNKKNDNNYHHLIAAATISILAIAIMVASTTSIVTTTTPVAATTTTPTASNTTATTPSSSSGIELSPQPIYQERSSEPNITPINQTHAILTFSGNGTLTLPNTTQTINTTSNATGVIISFTTSSGYAKETIRTENGETATVTFYEIVQFNPAAPGGGGGGKGIVTAVFQTNSSGTLAPLNGTIAAGIDDMKPNGESHVTLWKWESGISNNNINNSTGIAAPPPPSSSTMQGEPSLNKTTTSELPPMNVT